MEYTASTGATRQLCLGAGLTRTERVPSLGYDSKPRRPPDDLRVGQLYRAGFQRLPSLCQSCCPFSASWLPTPSAQGCDSTADAMS